MPENSKFEEDKEFRLSRERRIEFCREFIDEMRGGYFRGARKVAEEIYSEQQITAEEIGSTPKEIRDLLRGAAEELFTNCRSNITYFEDLKKMIHLCGFSLEEIGISQQEFNKFIERSQPEASEAERQRDLDRAKKYLESYRKQGDLGALQTLAAMTRYHRISSEDVGITNKDLYGLCFGEAKKILKECQGGDLRNFNILRGFITDDIMTEEELGTDQNEMLEFLKRKLQLRQ